MQAILVVSSVNLDSRTAKCMREFDRSPLTNVRWTVEVGIPAPRDRCLAVQIDGTWYIINRIDYAASSPVFPSNTLGTGVVESVDRYGAASDQSGNARSTVQTPADSLPGDEVLGGGMRGLVATLLGGSVIVRAGALSTAVFSRLGAYIRMVSRRWEQYSDAGREVQAGCGTQAYRYVETYKSAADMRGNLPSYSEASGDVRSALANKFDWQHGVVPAGDDDGIRYRQDVGPYSRTLNANGTEIETTGAVKVTTTTDHYEVAIGPDNAPTLSWKLEADKATLTIGPDNAPTLSWKLEADKATLTIGETTFVFTANSLTAANANAPVDIIAQTVHLLTHVHGGVTPGGSNTSGPA